MVYPFAVNSRTMGGEAILDRSRVVVTFPSKGTHIYRLDGHLIGDVASQTIDAKGGWNFMEFHGILRWALIFFVRRIATEFGAF